MLFKSALATELSGSLGGIVASHNRGGGYFRARTIPVNPATPQQEAVRGFMAFLTDAWSNVLTQVQREAWDTYAENVEITGPLGDPRNIGGLAHYVRSNVVRMQSPLPRVDDAPTKFGIGGYSPPTFASPSEATQDVLCTFGALDNWVNETQAAMIVYTSRPQNPSINFFKGPYRLADRILGSQPAPPPSPATLVLAFPFIEGQKIFFRVNVTRANGRLSTELRFSAVAAA